MLKKTITYTNPFTEQDVTEDHYFHISKADLVEMEMGEHRTKYTAKDGQELTGMQAKIQKIVDAEDGGAILLEIKAMIQRAYGKKVGDRFVKNAEIWEEFSSSEAYSQLIYDLCTNAEEAGKFMTGIVPSGLDLEAARKIAEQSADIADAEEAQAPQSVQSVTPLPEVPQGASADEPRLISRVDAINMDAADLQSGLATGRYKLS